MNDGINLLHKKNKFFNAEKTSRILRLISFVLLFVIFCSSIILFFLNLQSSLTPLQKEEKFVLSSLSRFNDKAAKLLLIQSRIKDISNILDKRPYFFEISNAIVKEIPPEVKISSITVDSKDISIESSSVSLSAIDLFLNRLLKLKINNKKPVKIVLNGINYDTKSGKYSFSVDLSL